MVTDRIPASCIDALRVPTDASGEWKRSGRVKQRHLVFYLLETMEKFWFEKRGGAVTFFFNCNIVMRIIVL